MIRDVNHKLITDPAQVRREYDSLSPKASMLLAQAGMMYGANGYMTPARVQHIATSGSGSPIISFTATPTPGNLLMVSFGSTVAKTVTAPGGWSEMTASIVAGSPRPLANHTFWKVAQVGETNSYTFVGSGGALAYNAIEFSGLVPIFTAIETKANTVGTTFTSAAYNTPSYPGIAYFNLAKNSGSVWVWGGAFTTISGSGNSKVGFKIYTAPATGEVAVCGPGSSETYNVASCYVKAKLK